MQGSNEPAERNLVIEDLKAVPGFSGRRHINERQKNAGDKLQNEDSQRRAAENIEPACGLARDRVLDRLANRRAKLKPQVEPRRRVS